MQEFTQVDAVVSKNIFAVYESEVPKSRWEVPPRVVILWKSTSRLMNR